MSARHRKSSQRANTHFQKPLASCPLRPEGHPETLFATTGPSFHVGEGAAIILPASIPSDSHSRHRMEMGDGVCKRNPGTPLGLRVVKRGRRVTGYVSLRCYYSSSWDAQTPPCLGYPDLSLAYAPPPPGSLPCLPFPQSESGASSGFHHILLTPSQHLHNQLSLPVSLLNLLSPCTSLPRRPRAGRRAGSMFYSSVSWASSTGFRVAPQ